MINVPKGLAPHEVDLYISAFKFCEKLIQEQRQRRNTALLFRIKSYLHSFFLEKSLHIPSHQ